MPKSANQKQKLLLIAQYFMEQTDEMHQATMSDLIAFLKENGISGERKSIYDDIDTLTAFGFDIIKNQGIRGGYFLGNREFELAEVKLLVDLVQSSKFITENKSRELIGKLEKLTSKNDAQALQRQVVVAERNKTSNENIYYSVDMIHQGIAHNVKIRFHYYEWTVDKTKQLKHDGEYYEVSPWLLTWNDENYYLVAYDDTAEKMKHYRVDKMLHIELTDHIRKGRSAYDKIDVASYTNRTFGMFDGEECTVTLVCDNFLTGVIIDRFGEDVALRRKDAEHVQAHVNVKVSHQFFGWLSGFGTSMWVAGPDNVVEEYRNYLADLLKKYQPEHS